MSFEDVLLKRLASCHADACKEIEKSLKAGRPIGDAVLDAIETLPVSKTRDLRRWLKDWEAWEEWQAWKEAWEEWQAWKAKGWAVKKVGTKVYVFPPLSIPPRSRDSAEEPPETVVAAAAGVNRIHARSDLRYRNTLPGGRPKPYMGSRHAWVQYLVSRLR